MQTHKNSCCAFINATRTAIECGVPRLVRGSPILEVIQHSFAISNPIQRVVIPVGRQSNTFAALAETMWVLGGRNDIEFLMPYMPKNAVRNSDDGKTWRGAYGPRIRSWIGRANTQIDQLKEVVRLLCEDRNTRRAVISLFDPAEDFTSSLDIPCNNWIHAIIRDNRLHLTIAIRSNDIWYGMSHINLFEWSVLQEAIALWTNADVGSSAMIIGSMHLYDQHIPAARSVLANWKDLTIYEYAITPVSFDVKLNSLDDDLSAWFEAEELARRDDSSKLATGLLEKSKFLSAALSMSIIWHCIKRGDNRTAYSTLLAMDNSDFKAAAVDWLIRKNVITSEDKALEDGIREYFADTGPACR